MPTPPVAVIGAGPIGLAAAAELVRRGQDVVVLERGARAAAGVRTWGHVRLFSPWAELTSPAAVALLQKAGWIPPDPMRCPTGEEWADRYLDPLAAALGDRVRSGSTVVGVSKADRDLLVDSGRDEQPFVLHVRAVDGSVSRLAARAVIDASGTLSTPNPLGAEGYPAAGEQGVAAKHTAYAIPRPDDLERYAGRATAVVGSGASALTALTSLTSDPLHTLDSRVVWVLRRESAGRAFGGGEADQLPARGALGTRVRAAVADGRIEVVSGFRTSALEARTDGRVALRSADGRAVDGLDEVVCVTGFRPDLSFLSEVRLDLDSRLEAPSRLAPEIDPNVHSCGSVRPHGHDVLEQPDRGLYLAGMKAYGRAPSFLALTGYEQVRSIAAALAGDLAAADAVQLMLPETGVCGGAGTFDEADGAGGCCGAPAGAGSQPIGLGVPADRLLDLSPANG